MERYTFPLSDAGFVQVLQTGATHARLGSHVTMRVEPIGMGQHALVVCVTPVPRPNREARGCNVAQGAQTPQTCPQAPFCCKGYAGGCVCGA